MADTSNRWWNRPFAALGESIRQRASDFFTNTWKGTTLFGAPFAIAKTVVGAVATVAAATIGGLGACVVKCVKGGIIDGARQAATGVNPVTEESVGIRGRFAGAGKFLGGIVGLGVLAATAVFGGGAIAGAAAGASAAASASAGVSSVVTAASATAGAFTAGATAVAGAGAAIPGLATSGVSAIASAGAAIPGLATAGASAVASAATAGASAATGAWAASTAAVGSALGIGATGGAVVVGTGCAVAGGAVIAGGARGIMAAREKIKARQQESIAAGEKHRANVEAFPAEDRTENTQLQQAAQALKAATDAQSNTATSGTPYRQLSQESMAKNIAATSPPNTETFDFVKAHQNDINAHFKASGQENNGRVKINEDNSFAIVGQNPIAAMGSLPPNDKLRQESYNLSLPAGTSSDAINRHLETANQNGIKIANIKIGNETFPVENGKIKKDTPAPTSAQPAPPAADRDDRGTGLR